MPQPIDSCYNFKKPQKCQERIIQMYGCSQWLRWWWFIHWKRSKELHLKTSTYIRLGMTYQRIKETGDIMTSQNTTTGSPLCLLKAMRETFQCSLCHIIPVKLPVIVTKCCIRLLGCLTYVDGWYSGQDALTKSSPKCQEQKGHNETMLLLGHKESKVINGSTRRRRVLNIDNV